MCLAVLCACVCVCRCVGGFVGRLCALYRRCFHSTRLCYDTDFTQLSHSDATQHCRRRASTLPVVLDRFESFDLRVFVEDDPTSRLMRGGAVWLAAGATRLADNANWQWLHPRSSRSCLHHQHLDCYELL